MVVSINSRLESNAEAEDFRGLRCTSTAGEKGEAGGTPSLGAREEADAGARVGRAGDGWGVRCVAVRSGEAGWLRAGERSEPRGGAAGKRVGRLRGDAGMWRARVREEGEEGEEGGEVGGGEAGVAVRSSGRSPGAVIAT
jgi:hypothetical protein